MSRLQKFMVCVTMLILSVSTLVAQPQPAQGGRPNMNDKEFAEFQIEMMTRQLHLEESTVEPFAILYTEYMNKMNALQPKSPRREGQPRQGGQPLERPQQTDEEIEAQILNSFDLAEKSNAIKREYYYKFKEVLTQQQILRMYNIERRLRERMLSESARRERD